MPNSIIITKTIAMVEPKTILQLLIFKIASTIANNTPHKHNIIPNSNEKLGIKSVYKIIFFIATETMKKNYVLIYLFFFFLQHNILLQYYIHTLRPFPSKMEQDHQVY